jgi:hypothetical protein
MHDQVDLRLRDDSNAYEGHESVETNVSDECIPKDMIRMVNQMRIRITMKSVSTFKSGSIDPTLYIV